jgi:hypothetical protein
MDRRLFSHKRTVKRRIYGRTRRGIEVESESFQGGKERHGRELEEKKVRQKFTPEQKAAVRATEAPCRCQVIAGPGSGKTRTLSG